MYASKALEPAAISLTAPETKRAAKKSEVARTAVEEHVTAVLHRRDEYVKKQNEPRLYAKALGEDSLAAISPWLERTRWLETYKDVRRDILKAMTSTPASRARTKKKPVSRPRGARRGVSLQDNKGSIWQSIGVAYRRQS